MQTEVGTLGPGELPSFEAIIEAALDAVVIMDERGLIRGWNRQAEVLFGRSKESVLRKPVADVIVPLRYREAHRAGLRKFMQSGEGPVLGQILQLSALRANGDEFPAELAISRPERTNGGLAFVAFIRDITDRVAALARIEQEHLEEAEALRERRAAEAAQARQHAQRMAELERLKTEFVKLASHELRGPLTVIRGYLSMMTDGTLADNEVSLPVLAAKANQMNLLLNQMLEVARLEDRGLRLNLRKVDLRDLVSDAFEQMLNLATSRHRLELDVAEEPLVTMADPSRVRVMVASLLDNAIKYSPEGHIRCAVELQGDSAVITVSDEGMGIAPEDMPRLFTRFGRIVTPDNSHIEGSGLGLYICREIALMHGGEIAAESAPRLGTVVRLTLPLASALEPRAASRSGVVELPAGPLGYDMPHLVPSEVVRLGAEIQRLGAEAADVDGFASSVVRYLFRHLVDRESGKLATSLVRLYLTMPFALLGPDATRFARKAAATSELHPQTRCLTLLGSAGAEEDWNYPERSRGHWVIPLPSEEALSQLPMVSQLMRQLGLDIGALLSPDPSLMVDVAPKTYNVFYVAEAAGSPHVPAQEDFVERHGIRSVVGFGGLLDSGQMFSVVTFTRVAVPRRSAAMFRVVAQAVKSAIESHGFGR